jgi:hypothetical protein
MAKITRPSASNRREQTAPGQGGGNVHFPVNGQSDYDYANPLMLPSFADSWLTYPTQTAPARSFKYTEWSPSGQDPQREYLNWWYAHMPHVRSTGPDARLANWWRYIADVDTFKVANRADFTGSDGTGTAWLTDRPRWRRSAPHRERGQRESRFRHDETQSRAFGKQ